jgi:hypothetical protein
MSIFISLITILGGRLLKMTNAVSRRKIQMNTLEGNEELARLCYTSLDRRNRPYKFFSEDEFSPVETMDAMLCIITVPSLVDADVSCNTDDSAVPVPTNATLALVGTFPILKQADHISCLQSLYLLLR